MAEQESIEARLARIEERLKNIDAGLVRQPICRHVTKDGECDFFDSVIEHDRAINQWTGALTAVSLISAFIGALIAGLITKIWK